MLINMLIKQINHMTISMNNIMIPILFSAIITLIMLLIAKKKIMPVNYMMALIMMMMMLIMINYMFNQKSMPCYMVFLSMISGIMIMFLYFVSLINNHLYKFNYFYTIYTYILLTLFILSSILSWYHNYNFSYQSLNKNSIYMIYLFPLNMLTILMILYLLMTLYMSMKTCFKKFKQPLRKIKN